MYISSKCSVVFVVVVAVAVVIVAVCLHTRNHHSNRQQLVLNAGLCIRTAVATEYIAGNCNRFQEGAHEPCTLNSLIKGTCDQMTSWNSCTIN